MKLLVKLFFVLTLFQGTLPVSANNFRFTTPVKVMEVVGGVATLEVELSWDNSWFGDQNWDAVWLFVKVRPIGGAWSPVNLQDQNYVAAGDFQVKNGKSGGNVVGVFVFRKQKGVGNASTKVTLRYACGSYTKADFDQSRVSLLAQGIEMVYLPSGKYNLGDGGSTGRLATTDGRAVVVNDEGAMSGVGVMTDGAGWQAVNVAAAYPKGYQNFYVMKYEIGQEQYVSFLNSLPRNKQEELLGASHLASLQPGQYVFGRKEAPDYRNGIILQNNTTGQPCVFGCNLNGNTVQGEEDDGQSLACNYLSINDLITYAEWSGLRPMSELEYERACRAPYPQAVVPGEYAWNTASGVVKASSVTAGGSDMELADGSANVNGGNAFGGPLRCGVFATSTSTQQRAGATYWGVLDMSGNVGELVAGVANAGLDKAVNGTGVPGGSSWSKTPAHYGVRGGSFAGAEALMHTSDRTEMTNHFSAVTDRKNTVGFRLVRTELFENGTINPGAITLSGTLCPGVAATITEAAPASMIPSTGVAFSYQWFVKAGSGDFTPLAGETGKTLAYSNFMGGKSYQFKRKVTCGSIENESVTNEVTVLLPVTVTTQPANHEASCGLSLSVSVSGSEPLSYQWKKAEAEIPGATSASYTKKPTTSKDAGNYICIITNSCGEVKSSAAKVTMNDTSSALKTMTDPRDGQVYATRIMPDKKEWMVEDLRFGTCNGDVLNESYNGVTYTGNCQVNSISGAGHLYDWKTTMQCPDCGFNESGYPYGKDICPDGWHVPESYDFDQLNRLLCWDNKRIYPGTDDWQGVLNFDGYNGRYWSSIASDNRQSYVFNVSEYNANRQGFYKDEKACVRCIKD